MRLPEGDENYLNNKGHAWELVPDGSGACLVFKDYVVSTERYDRSKTDLMIRIPAGYNNAGLDMFYVDPPLKLKNTNTYPKAAEVFETHAGRTWQRFSRHLPAAWRAGVDGLPMFLALVQRELQAKDL